MSNSQSASVVVQAPPETVWAMVADITRMGEWSPETRSAEWVDGATGPEVGARFKGHNQRGPIARWTTTCTVTECERGRVFGFVVGEPDDPQTLWRYSFVPAPDGGTMVTEMCELQKPIPPLYRLGNLLFGVTDRPSDLKHGIEQTLAKLQVAARAATL
jgi:uncharacterized protein YndB with AHSA1/START domain